MCQLACQFEVGCEYFIHNSLANNCQLLTSGDRTCDLIRGPADPPLADACATASTTPNPVTTQKPTDPATTQKPVTTANPATTQKPTDPATTQKPVTTAKPDVTTQKTTQKPSPSTTEDDDDKF